jgi:DNA polymerase-3 subunit gamma/tau
MLSAHSFNALLKTLEEPPPHVKFLLATTDPHKLPVTVLSRCLQFNLKNLTPERLVEHIRHILTEEQIPFEDAALWQLGRAAQGSVRDCLTLLDQAIGFCDANITDAGVRELLGNIDRSVIVQLMDALVAQDAAALLNQVAVVAEHAPDFAVILQELLSWLHRVAIAQVVPDGIDNSQGDRDQILQHAAALPAETVQLYYQIALKGREDLPWALDTRSGLEMTLLRMLAFTPAGIPNVPATTLAAQGPAPEPAHRTPDDPETGQKKKPVADPVPQRAREVVDVSPSAHDAPRVPEHLPAAHPPSAVAPPTDNVVQEAEVAAPQAPPGIALADLKPSLWIDLFGQLPLSGVARSIAAHCVLAEVSGNRLALLLQESQATLFSDEHRKRIEAALAGYFAVPVTLQMTAGPITGETPAAYRQRKETERLQAAVTHFTGDAVVQAVVQRFGGSIVQDSITPLTPLNC